MKQDIKGISDLKVGQARKVGRARMETILASLDNRLGSYLTRGEMSWPNKQ